MGENSVPLEESSNSSGDKPGNLEAVRSNELSFRFRNKLHQELTRFNKDYATEKTDLDKKTRAVAEYLQVLNKMWQDTYQIISLATYTEDHNFKDVMNTKMRAHAEQVENQANKLLRLDPKVREVQLDAQAIANAVSRDAKAMREFSEGILDFLDKEEEYTR